MPAPSVDPEIPPVWATVNRKGEPTVICPPPSKPAPRHTPPSAASFSKPGSSTAISPTKHQSAMKTTKKPKKKKKAADAPNPVTPAKATPSPGTDSGGSFPSIGKIIRSKQAPKPKHMPQATSQSPTSTRPVLAHTDGNIHRGTPKCVPETPQRQARHRSKTVATESSQSMGKGADSHAIANTNSREPASEGKAVERREQPVREVKLMTSVEQTPRRGKGPRKHRKSGDGQCPDGDSERVSSSYRSSSRLGSSTEIVGRAESVVEPASTGPDIIELSESPSPQRCRARPASLDLGGPSSSPSRQLRASTEREPSPLVVNVAWAVCHPKVANGADVQEEAVAPVQRPRIITRLHSPSPPIILPLAQGSQPRKRKIALIKQADHARVQRDLEEHDVREVGEARFLTGSYEFERQKQDDLERKSREEIRTGKTKLIKLKTRMEHAKKKEYKRRGQRRNPKKHEAQQQMSANVTQANQDQVVGPQFCPGQQFVHSHDSQEQRRLPDVPIHDQPHKTPAQPIEPDTQGHRAPRNTPETCAIAESGRVRKRAATVGASLVSLEAQDREHRPKLQSKERRSSTAAARERFHKTCGPPVIYTPGSGEVTQNSESQRNAAQGSESSSESNPKEVSRVKHIHDEGTVGNEEALKAPGTSKAAKSVKRIAVDRERFSSSKDETQGASSRSEQPPMTPKSARAQSSKSDAKGNSTAKSSLGLQAAVQAHGRDLQQGLQKPGQTTEGTVVRTFQPNIEVRALIKSRSAHTQMASPVAPPSPIHPRRSLPAARHGGFATLAELRRREVDIPLPRCTCQDLSPYFTEQQKRLPSRFHFQHLYHGGPLEFFAMISQVMDCRGHHDVVRDHCRSLWDREAKRPDTWCTFSLEADSSTSSTSKTASAALSHQKQSNRTEADSRPLPVSRNRVTTSIVRGQPTPPASSPPSSKKRKRSHVNSREAEVATEMTPQADLSDDTTSSSPSEKRKKRHTNSDAAQKSSSRKQLEGKASASPARANPKSKKRRHQSESPKDYDDAVSPVATPSAPTSNPTSSDIKRKRASDREQGLAPAISSDSSSATISTQGMECERDGNALEVSPPQNQGNDSSINELNGKRQCLSKKDARRATASVSPFPSTFNDIDSEDDWRPFMGLPDEDMPGDTVNTPPPSSPQADEPFWRKPSDKTASKPACPAIDTPAPARFASVPASRSFGQATRAVMNITGKPPSSSLYPNARPENLNSTGKQQFDERVAAEIEKRATEAVEKFLARHEIAGSGPRTTATRKRSRTQAEGDNDDPDYWTKLYPPHTRLSNEGVCAIARDTNLGPQKRHDAAPYAFDPKNGQFRADYEHLFPQVGFETIQAARRFLRTH